MSRGLATASSHRQTLGDPRQHPPRTTHVRLARTGCRSQALESILSNLISVGKQGGYLGNNVPLTIYLDVPRGEATQPEEVVRIANSFEWPHGPKSVAQLVEKAELHLQTLVPPESPGGTLAHPTHSAAVSILEARRGLIASPQRALEG